MAWNDPQWGNKNSGGNSGGNGGPPDLDELFKRFNQRLSGLFGRKGNGPVSGGGEPANAGNLAGVLIGLGFLVWVASGFYIVDASERGVVQRFGKYVETTDAGAHWHWPWPIESSTIVNVDSVRTIEVGYRGSAKNPQEALMLTDDENIVDLQFAVQYNLKSAEDFLFINRYDDQSGGEDAVRQVAETAMREVVGKSKMDFVLNVGRAEVAAQSKVLMQEILDRYHSGINISQVTLQNVQAPEQVLAAFEDVQKANQDRDRLKNEAQAYSNDVVPRARGEAARLLQEAEGYRQKVVDNAEGEASRFNQILAEYKRAPGVTRERMYIDAMQQVMNNTTKIVVDQKGNGSLLYLPLDKLQQIANQPAATQAPVPASAPASSTSSLPPLSAGREVLGRDRGERP